MTTKQEKPTQEEKEAILEEKKRLKQERLKQREHNKAKEIFISHILARKHKCIYISRANPKVMYCSNISPDLLFHHARMDEECVHKITSHEHDIFSMWEELWPIVKRWNHICINRKGMEKLYREFKDDKARIADMQREDNVIFIVREKKVGKRVKQEVTPVVWGITVDELNALDSAIEDHLTFEKNADHVEHQLLPVPTGINVKNIFFISPESKPFGRRLRVPYINGVTGPNIKGYCTRANIDGVYCHWCLKENIVRFYCTSKSEICDTISVMTSNYYFNLK